MSKIICSGLREKIGHYFFTNQIVVMIGIILFSFLIFNLVLQPLNLKIVNVASAEVDQELLGSGPGRFNSIVAEDIDDDNRFELVFGNYDGYVVVLEYRDGDFYEEWRSPKIGHRVWGITVADFIGDSTKEIIAGNGDGEIHIYNAKTHKQVWHASDLVRDVHGLLVHDLGQDGTPYLLAGTGYKTDNDLGTVYIFTANQTKPIAKIGAFNNRLRGIGVGDVDSDGALEIVVGSGVATGENPGEGYIRIFDVEDALNPATLQSDKPIVPEWKSKNLKGDCVAIALEDFTGDGYPDIVVGNGYRYQAGWVRILTYDSGSQDYIEYWKSPSEPDIGPKPYGLAVGDIDNDGNIEIVVGNQAGYIYIFEHSGSSVNQEWKSNLLGSDILGMDIADVDADGQIEIIACQGGYTGKGDYTSGYTEPHIYIIDGKTHKIEIVIGETQVLEVVLLILILISIILFLIGLNYYVKYRTYINELEPKQSSMKTKNHDSTRPPHPPPRAHPPGPQALQASQTHPTTPASPITPSSAPVGPGIGGSFVTQQKQSGSEVR